MANLTFPSNPTNGQKFTVNGKVFEYNSTTQRWSASRIQLLGDLTTEFTVDAPSLGVSLNTVALDTTGANVFVTYTVDQDVKASITTAGIANSDLATISLSQSNNTITITAGTLAFSNGQINLVVTNGRTSNTAVINVSASYGGWTGSISGLTYDNTSFFIGNEETSSNNIDISKTGEFFYVTGRKDTDGLRLYQMSTPFDITSATFLGTTQAVSLASGLCFSSDGTQLYVIADIILYWYTLSTPWDTRTATYNSALNVRDIGNSRQSFHNTVLINPNGTRMYISARGSNEMNQLDLSTPYDIQTATYNGVFYLTRTAGFNTFGARFDGNGEKLFVTEDGIVREHSLSVPYDISSASYTGIQVSMQGSGFTGIAFNDDGTKMYNNSSSPDNVYQYTTGI